MISPKWITKINPIQTYSLESISAKQHAQTIQQQMHSNASIQTNSANGMPSKQPQFKSNHSEICRQNNPFIYPPVLKQILQHKTTHINSLNANTINNPTTQIH